MSMADSLMRDTFCGRVDAEKKSDGERGQQNQAATTSCMRSDPVLRQW